MSSHANTMPEFSGAATPPAAISSTQPVYWSIRRELWEYRSIYVAPLAVSALTVAGFLLATIGRALSTSDLAHRRRILAEPYTFATGVVMVTMTIVGLYYCLEALQGERRDRSILFWKSLPVSDLTTVLAKASIPFVVLPFACIFITFATNWLMMLMGSAVMLGSGMSPAPMWRQLLMIQTSLVYHIVTVHILWYAPIYSWLLLISAWARRAALLWTALPLIAIGILEKLTFSTSHFFHWLMYRAAGPESYDMGAPGFAMDPMMHLNLERFLSTPGLWMGLLLAGFFLAVAVRVRRYREPA